MLLSHGKILACKGGIYRKSARKVHLKYNSNSSFLGHTWMTYKEVTTTTMIRETVLDRQKSLASTQPRYSCLRP